MATNSNQPWFKKDPEQGYKNRVARISRMRDAGTFADELLLGARFLLFLSLAFTGALCFFSYKFFLERFLPFEAAIIAAIAMTILIEYGKQSLGMSALRLPFLQGWGYIMRTVENSIMFAGTAAFALLIFGISVYNSTNGASRYAENTAQQRTETVFQPNTAELDAQIAAAQESVTNAPKAKWKGREYYQSPASVKAAQRTIETLSRQREKERTDQRADFERSRAQNDNAASHSGSIALRVGGWLETVQILLMLVMSACERVLDRRSSTSTQSSPAQQSQKGIGFHTAGVTAQAGQSDQQAPAQQNPQPPRQQIGFHRYDGSHSDSTVPQFTPPVAQPQATKGLLTGTQADDALKHHLMRLQKEPSHFQRTDVNKESVFNRICGIMRDIDTTLSGVESCSIDVAERIDKYYTNKVAPILSEHGFYYEPIEIITKLYSRAQGGAAQA